MKTYKKLSYEEYHKARTIMKDLLVSIRWTLAIVGFIVIVFVIVSGIKYGFTTSILDTICN